ncbi:MAG: Imidazole glycerol phosphate synthase subunit HisF [Candidatus Omnitrophica bacterium]|nr:Imidazole glycerol phosphate synthase subunit HisF [Candidatus Omnitrophota bacterium]
MVLSKPSNVRVIPRLDIKGPNLVKGIQFDGNRVLGTPEAFAEIYYREGADELIFYDIVASLYQRNTLLEYIRKTAEKIFIPLTVVGGIRSVEDVREILRAGADKVGINTAAIENPELLREASRTFGSQCIVSCIEYWPHSDGTCEAWVDYGRQLTGVNAYDWARRAVDLGAGEIFLTSIRQEGMGTGYDVDFVRKVAEAVPVPVIACGGAGKKEDFLKVIREGRADAVSAASCFHYYYATPPGDDRPWMSFEEPRLRMGEDIDSGNIDFLKEGYGGYRDIQTDRIGLPALKSYLSEQGVPVRPTAASTKIYTAIEGKI